MKKLLIAAKNWRDARMDYFSLCEVEGKDNDRLKAFIKIGSAEQNLMDAIKDFESNMNRIKEQESEDV